VTYRLQSKKVIEIRHHASRTGKDVFDDWLTQLADARAQAKIASRINRLAAGNFGDCKSLRQGVSELRIDWDRATVSITR
jgi:putative addiction module killer protein